MMLQRHIFSCLVSGLLAAAAVLASPALAQPKPITIGFGMALTGGLAPNGKAALLAMQLWETEVNAKGGLLGRPVKLVFYDDQSNPSVVPGIYTKLLDVDKVDLVTSGYATNMVAPAMPVVMQHNRIFFALLGLAVNSEFHYPNYFSFGPTGGPKPKESFSRGFFEVAMAQDPKPQTVAIVGADAEFPRNALDGARAIIQEKGLKIVYDKTYPPSTADYTPIVRAIQSTNPDLVFVASYPPDTVGILRAASEIGLKTKLFGGGMVGLQATAIKAQLGPLLNGIVDYDFWLPTPAFATPEALDMLKRYQAKSAEAGVDLLGYYLPPFAYSMMQVIQQAVEATQSLDDEKLAAYLRATPFKTVAGPIQFNDQGEWVAARVLEVQFQNVQGNGIEQFRDLSVEKILWPPAYKTGDVIYPYSDRKK